MAQAILTGKAVHLFVLSTLSYWPLRWSSIVVGQSECDGWAYRQVATLAKQRNVALILTQVATYLLKS